MYNNRHLKHHSSSIGASNVNLTKLAFSIQSRIQSEWLLWAFMQYQNSRSTTVKHLSSDLNVDFDDNTRSKLFAFLFIFLSSKALILKVSLHLLLVYFCNLYSCTAASDITVTFTPYWSIEKCRYIVQNRLLGYINSVTLCLSVQLKESPSVSH